MRNAAIDIVARSEDQVRRLLAEATAEDLIAMVEAFAPICSAAPECTRTLEELAEQICTCASKEAVAGLQASVRARSPAWLAVANKFFTECGEVGCRRFHQSAVGTLAGAGIDIGKRDQAVCDGRVEHVADGFVFECLAVTE